MKPVFAPKHTQALELNLKDTWVIYNKRSELFDTDAKENVLYIVFDTLYSTENTASSKSLLKSILRSLNHKLKDVCLHEECLLEECK